MEKSQKVYDDSASALRNDQTSQAVDLAETVTKREDDGGRPPGHLVRGKSEDASTPAKSEPAGGGTDPAVEAAEIATTLQGGVEAIIAAAEKTHAALKRFASDDAQQRKFFAELSRHGVIPPSERDLGASGSKASKLGSIGEHAHVLRHPQIMPCLSPSYTAMYEIVLVYRELPGKSDETKIEQLRKGLLDCGGELTRSKLKKMREHMTQTGNPGTPAEPDSESVNRSTLAKLMEDKRQCNLLLLTPDRRQLDLLGQDYPSDKALDHFLPIRRIMTRDGIVVVVARVSDLPQIVNKVLPACGLRREKSILLRRQPSDPEVINADVIIVAGRAPVDDLMVEHLWSEDGKDLTSLDIADRLVPAAKTKVHAFAVGETDGWCALVGDDTWAEKPSV